MISRFSVITLVVFFLSAIFVIQPVSIPIWPGKRRIWISLNTAPILAIAILWASQCLGPAQIRTGIVGADGVKPYNILILFITLAYMAITLDITGVLQAAAFWVRNKGGTNTRRLFLYFYVMLLLFSIFVGNDPVILSGTPFLVYYTRATGLDHTAWVIAEFAAANTASMVLFLGNPTNVVICEGFSLNYVAFTAYTAIPFIACAVTGYAALAAQFLRNKYLPKTVPRGKPLKISEALLDPVGALVGGLLLGSCLVVIVVVSFLKVDVWMITLPFAFAKFVFDLIWDHHRYRTGQMPDYDKDPEAEIKRAMSTNLETTSSHSNDTTLNNGNGSLLPTTTKANTISLEESGTFPLYQTKFYLSFRKHFPTIAIALPRLPFILIPFAFSQFILIEALAHHGWMQVFGHWLIKVTGNGQLHPTIWVVGILGVILCNIAGTNIGATILLTKIIRAAPGLSHESERAAAIALAISSNIGAVSFTFSASLAGLLWMGILKQKQRSVSQLKFAYLNLAPLAVMTAVGLSAVSLEMEVLHRRR